MRLRYLFLIVFIHLCFSTFNVNASSINYNLRIDKSLHFYETITYNVEKKDVKNDGNYYFLTSIVKDPIYFDLKEEVRYKKSKVTSNNGYIVSLKHDYSYLFLSKSRIINECFVNKNYNNSGSSITFEASDFYCSHRADSIKVTINTDLDVLNSNANSSNNNTYIWNNMSNNSSIKFKVKRPDIETEPMDDVLESEQTEESSNNEEPSKKSISSNVLIVIFFLVFVIVVIGFMILKRKKEELDRF